MNSKDGYVLSVCLLRDATRTEGTVERHLQSVQRLGCKVLVVRLRRWADLFSYTAAGSRVVAVLHSGAIPAQARELFFGEIAKLSDPPGLIFHGHRGLEHDPQLVALGARVGARFLQGGIDDTPRGFMAELVLSVRPAWRQEVEKRLFAEARRRGIGDLAEAASTLSAFRAFTVDRLARTLGLDRHTVARRCRAAGVRQPSELVDLYAAVIVHAARTSVRIR